MKRRILIFDDNTDVLSICQYILEELDFEVHTRTNCNNIISVLTEIQPDIILMDNRIPDKGGISATRTIKNDPVYKNTPVIYFTANNDIESLAKIAGADAIITKPFDIDELESIVSSIEKF